MQTQPITPASPIAMPSTNGTEENQKSQEAQGTNPDGFLIQTPPSTAHVKEETEVAHKAIEEGVKNTVSTARSAFKKMQDMAAICAHKVAEAAHSASLKVVQVVVKVMGKISNFVSSLFS